MAFAHSRNGRGERHDLVAHLRAVANLAAHFAAAFQAAEAGRYVGLSHDLGKFHPLFQAYLRACEEHPSQPGHRRLTGQPAALNRLGPLGLLAQGHHSHLQRSAQKHELGCTFNLESRYGR